MKNKAKCKLCDSIIESFHPQDYVECKCGEIAVDGGLSMRCAAKHWENFLRIDSDNKEHPVHVRPQDVKPLYNESSKPKLEDVIEQLEMMVNNINELPPQALKSPINHYDLLRFLSLFLDFFKSLR